MPDQIDFSDLIPAQPQAVGQAPPPPVNPAVVQGQASSQQDPKTAFVSQFVSSGRGSPADAEAAWNALQQGGAPASGASFAPGGPAGAVPTAAQEAYARAAGQPFGAVGGGQNPYFDAPGGQAPPNAAHVTQQGYLVDPNGAIRFDDLIPAPNLMSDVGQSVLTGLQRGAGGIVALPQSLLDGEQQGIAKAAGVGADLLGQNGQALYSRLAQRPSGINLPTQGQVDGAIQSVAGPYHAPQTTAGRYAEAVAEAAPSAIIGPEGWVSRAAIAVAPAVASQGAADAVSGMGHPEWAPYARTGAALAAGGLVNAGANIAKAGPLALADATSGLTDAHVAAAQELRQKAAAMGVPLSIPEAIEAVAPGSTRLPAMQQVVERTPAGRASFAPAMAARPGAIQAAAGPVFDQIAPSTSQPSMIGLQAQGVAQSALDRTRQAVNAQASPMYQAAQNDLIAPADYASLDADPSYQIALKSVRSNPELGPSVAHLPDNNAAVVNEVVKELDRSSNAARVTEMNPGGNNALAAVRDRAAALANRVAGAASSNYSGARSTVAQGMAQDYSPLQAGPVGAIAATENVPAQTRALYPARPLEGAPAETTAAIEGMNAAQQAAPGASSADPLVTALLTRQHLANTFNEATQATARGPNAYGGAQWSAGVAGNPEQAATLNAGVRAAAGDAAAQRLADLLDVTKATGARLPVSPSDEATAALVNPHGALDPMELATTLGVGHEAFGPAGAVVAAGSKGLSSTLRGLGALKAKMNAQYLADALQTPADQTGSLMSAVKKEGYARARRVGQLLLGSGVGADNPQ